MVSGTFELRGMIIKSLKPPCFSVAVVFEGFEEHVITLTDVVGRATLLEVIRRASHKLSESPRSAVQNEGDSYIELSPWTDYRVEVRHSGSMKLENPFSVSSLGRMTVAKLLEDVACRSDTSGSQQAHIQLFLYAERPGSSSPGAFSACGLINIGNTCYMNSALQCVLNMRELRRELVSFPLSERVDPLLTSELLELLLQMKSGKICTADPTNLKRAIGLREEQFYTYEQQDAAEFIEVLLDGVHEEMNNVSTKFYRQRSDSDVNFSTRELSEIFWADFLKNNQSFIPELFFHQSVVRFTCSACGKKSAVFENNSTLVVALANPSKRIFSVSVLMHDSDLHTIQVMVPHEADGTISVPALQQEVEAHVKKLIQDQGYLDSSGYAVEHKVDKHRVIVHANPKMPIPVGRKHLCAVLASSVCVTEEASLSPLLDQTSPSLGDAAEEGGGSVATVAEEKGKSDEVTEQRYIWYFFRNLVSGPYDERPKLCRVEKVASDQVVEGSKLKEHILNQSNNLCKHLVRETADLAADSLYSHAGAVPEQSYYASVQSISVYFYKTCDDNGCCLSPDDTTAFGLATSKDLSILLTAESSVLIMYGQYRNTAGTCSRYISPFFYECGYTNNSYCNGDCSVTIDECLQHTFSLESLTGDNAMYCGTCNTLRDGQIERRLFRLPPCLLVSLGRFKVNLQGSTKNCAYVMFDGSLNLAPHLDSESSEKHTTYELVGVVFHRGTLSYGHYTAATRNGPGGEWFFCDDSRVASLKGEPWKYPLAGDAYILCYERQKEGSESDSIIQNKTMQ
ncbi:putative Ubiquitin carboxyl terminal hydrolase [Trypanosoma vivax]|nr:putative Ubiquitin carboxyl terminal hydrolase [Trypanosoma vivax]